MLAQMIANETAEGIELSTGINLEVLTASFRAVRGYTVVAAILDELAFWPCDDAADPDTEILNALRPSMATIPGALLVAISSPYAQKGELYRAHREHFGKDHDPILVWQADSKTMNPNVPQVVIDQAYAQDEAAASAEYGAQFRRDVESYVRAEAVQACIILGRYEVAFVQGQTYVAFVDPSGGSQDSMTLGIGHTENGLSSLDLMREVKPPFSPEAVVADFCALLKSYHLSSVTGDRYGGEWCREPFRKHGIDYKLSTQSRSDLYSSLLPLINSGMVQLLDEPRLIAQLNGLERRTARGGKDSIDHGHKNHDDLINAAAGALVLAHQQASRPKFDISHGPLTTLGGIERQSERATAEILRRVRTGAAWFPGE